MLAQMAGEFRCIVKNADGTTKLDTGFQKNLILNQGLDYFGGGNGTDMRAHCLLGSGNSIPAPTQTSLDDFIAANNSILAVTNSHDYDADRDGDLYKNSSTYTYQFLNLESVNISEIGLASQYGSATEYYLCTRALIKDANGAPTTISINEGETLQVQYKIWRVFSLIDKTGKINLTDGDGVSTEYNYTVRMAGVGGTSLGGSNSYKNDVGQVMRTNAGNAGHAIYNGSLGDFTAGPNGSSIWYAGDSRTLPIDNYVQGSYKAVIRCALPLDAANGIIKTFLLLTSMGFFQIEYSKVSDNSGISKNNTQVAELVFEVSWGRYEGEL
ncbi:hypothetical protein [Psychrobacter sp. PSP]|uniref:hypothetical protein n=1 Tax=Psychrobacter sp. PSP TaxID=2734636 RepID=UPI002095C2B4|nr:hypothetical protein [Psychrobacter sp. PSP]